MTYSINQTTIDVINEKAFNQKLLDDIKKQPNCEIHEEYQQILINSISNPGLYQPFCTFVNL